MGAIGRLVDQGPPFGASGLFRLFALPLSLTPFLAVLEELLDPAQEYRAAPAFGQPLADRRLVVGEHERG